MKAFLWFTVSDCLKYLLAPALFRMFVNYCKHRSWYLVGSMEAPSKAFLLFFLLPDWLKSNHLKSRMECGFLDIFSRHIFSTVAETIDVTNYSASFDAKKCSENHIQKLLR